MAAAALAARRFRPSVVKAICKEVVDGFLKEREWKGDEETVWTRTLADEIRTRVKGEGNLAQSRALGTPVPALSALLAALCVRGRAGGGGWTCRGPRPPVDRVGPQPARPRPQRPSACCAAVAAALTCPFADPSPRASSSPLAALGLPRYKFVVQVSLGEVRGQGVRVASRCLWDTDTDNHASYSFRSDSVWCSVMVFGLYAE